MFNLLRFPFIITQSNESFTENTLSVWSSLSLALDASFPLGFQTHVTSHMETVYRPESTNEDDLTKMEHVSPQLGSPYPTATATA